MLNAMAPGPIADRHSTTFRPISNAPISRKRLVVTRAGFLDFLAPSSAKTGRKAGRSEQLVGRLLELTRNTEGGLKASLSRKNEIEEVVEELSEYCMRSPLRSDLIFGEWEVVYASKPQTAGGPFRSPIGRIVFPGQRAVQVIAEPNICINEVSYKALGFIPGAARQEGEIEPINETTFQITFPALDNKKRIAGGPPKRLIEVAYLDERIRIGKALPQNEDDEGSFYVFERVEQQEDEDDDDDEIEEDEQPRVFPPRRQVARGRTVAVQNDDDDDDEKQPSRRAAPFSLPSFGTQIFTSKEGRATMAERSVAARGGRVQQQTASSGTQRRGSTSAAPVPPVRKSREELAAERAAAKAQAEEKRRQAAESAAAARAKAEEEKKRAAEERRRAQAAAEAERAAAAQRQAAAREAYQELANAATEAANEARDAASAYKSVEREASALVRAAAQARGIIARAVAAAEEAASELAAAQSEEISIEKELLEKQRFVNQLEKKLRDASASIAPKIAKK